MYLFEKNFDFDNLTEKQEKELIFLYGSEFLKSEPNLLSTLNPKLNVEDKYSKYFFEKENKVFSFLPLEKQGQLKDLKTIKKGLFKNKLLTDEEREELRAKLKQEPHILWFKNDSDIYFEFKDVDSYNQRLDEIRQNTQEEYNDVIVKRKNLVIVSKLVKEMNIISNHRKRADLFRPELIKSLTKFEYMEDEFVSRLKSEIETVFGKHTILPKEVMNPEFEVVSKRDQLIIAGMIDALNFVILKAHLIHEDNLKIIYPKSWFEDFVVFKGDFDSYIEKNIEKGNYIDKKTELVKEEVKNLEVKEETKEINEDEKTEVLKVKKPEDKKEVKKDLTPKKDDKKIEEVKKIEKVKEEIKKEEIKKEEIKKPVEKIEKPIEKVKKPVIKEEVKKDLTPKKDDKKIEEKKVKEEIKKPVVKEEIKKPKTEEVKKAVSLKEINDAKKKEKSAEMKKDLTPKKDDKKINITEKVNEIKKSKKTK